MKNRPALRCPRSSAAGDEVEPPPQDLDPVQRFGGGEPDVGVHRDHGCAVRVDGPVVGGLELAGAAEGGTVALGPPHDQFLLVERGPVPRLDVHPDAPGHEVGAAGHPVGAVALLHPHVLVQQVRLLGLEVVRAVLEAEEVAGRGLLGRRRRGAAVPQLRPPHRRRPEADAEQVAHRVHGDLRVVRAGLDADVAARAGGVEPVAPECGKVGQLGRAPVGDAELVEERGAEPDGHRQRRRREVERLTGVVGRGLAVEGERAVLRSLQALGHALGGSRPACSASAGPRPCRWRSGRVR